MAEKKELHPVAQRCAEIAFEQYALGNRSVCMRSALAALMLQPGHPSHRGLLSIIARSAVGAQAVERLRSLTRRPREEQAAEAAILEQIRRDPTHPQRHVELGRVYLSRGSLIQGYACLRTASTLAKLRGSADPVSDQELLRLHDQLGIRDGGGAPSERLLAWGDPGHRLTTLAREITAAAVTPQPRVLDIGGGDGFLGVLLLQAHYALIEPCINGLSGLSLPFSDKTFDVVVSSHSLEHIAAGQREQFLSELIRSSSHLVLILAPFAPAVGRPNTEESIIHATGADWAKEHLAHGLPALNQVTDFLKRQSLRYEVAPHADARVMYWQYLAKHFAARAGEADAVLDAIAFFQEHFDYRPATPDEPHDFLVRVWVS